MSEEINKDIEVVETKSDGIARFSNEKTLRNAESVDSFHHDQAAKVLVDYKAAGGPEEWSSLEEKNLIRKIDRRLLPVLAFTFFLTWYDKGILSQAVSISSTLSSALALSFTKPTRVGWLTRRVMLGNIRSERRPEAGSGQPLLLLVLDILHRISHWMLSPHTTGPKVSHGARCLSFGHHLGHLCLVNRRLLQLQGPLRPTLLPWVPGERRHPDICPHQRRSHRAETLPPAIRY